MASSRAKYNKNKELTGYEIRVSRGYDAFGKQRKPYVMTWKLPEGWWGWSKKTQQKELERAMFEFESDCNAGKVKLKEEKIAEALAQAKLEQQKKEAEANKLSFSDAFELYINKTKSKKKINTITGIKTTMCRALERFGNTKVEKLSETDCQDYIDDLFEDCNLKISTVRKHYATLSAFLKWCVDRKIIEFNPMKNVEKPVDNDGEENVETFSIEEMKKIIKCSEEEPLMWRAMLCVLADSGLRRGEVCAIRWADIDFSSGRVHIVNNAQYTEGKGTYDTNTKSKKNRDIFVSEKVIDVLKEWKALQKEVVVGQGLPAPKHVFTHLDGNRINPQAPTAYFRKFGEKYGIEGCHPHKFRHTMATMMIQQGADIKTVSEKLGHSSVEITLKLYVHTNEEAQKAANQKYSSLLW